MKNLVIDDKKIKLQIWDTAGQERFKSLTPMYYRDAKAALLVYDITSATTFAKVKDWVNELRVGVPDDIIMVVVGNKLDRADKHREIKTDVGQEYARSVGATFTETSAKTKEGVEELFRDVAVRLLQSSQPTPPPPGSQPVLSPNKPPNDNSDGTCPC